MRANLRDAVREQYAYRCGYCGVREVDAGAQLTVEHFQPRVHGGSDEPENLVYACHACNEFKGDWWLPDSSRRILHPQREDLTRHITLENDLLLAPLTETGAFHIERLRLNRAELVVHRRLRGRVGAAQSTAPSVEDRLNQLEAQVRELVERIRPREQ